jgi:hypothetical protein
VKNVTGFDRKTQARSGFDKWKRLMKFTLPGTDLKVSLNCPVVNGQLISMATVPHNAGSCIGLIGTRKK